MDNLRVIAYMNIRLNMQKSTWHCEAPLSCLSRDPEPDTHGRGARQDVQGAERSEDVRVGAVALAPAGIVSTIPGYDTKIIRSAQEIAPHTTHDPNPARSRARPGGTPAAGGPGRRGARAADRRGDRADSRGVVPARGRVRDPARRPIT